MVASHDRENSSGMREFTFFNLFNIGSVNSNWNIMFTFAGRSTGMATDTFSVINNKSEFHG
jgi:hypothetical protein